MFDYSISFVKPLYLWLLTLLPILWYVSFRNLEGLGTAGLRRSIPGVGPVDRGQTGLFFTEVAALGILLFIPLAYFFRWQAWIYPSLGILIWVMAAWLAVPRNRPMAPLAALHAIMAGWLFASIFRTMDPSQVGNPTPAIVMGVDVVLLLAFAGWLLWRPAGWPMMLVSLYHLSSLALIGVAFFSLGAMAPKLIPPDLVTQLVPMTPQLKAQTSIGLALHGALSVVALCLAWWSWHTIHSMQLLDWFGGNLRRLSAIGLRTAVLALFILSLAEIQIVRTSERLTTIFLLDQSLSIPEDGRRVMVEYVNKAIKAHREKNDRVGVIVFGREAGIEIPPFDDDVQLITPLEAQIDQRYTDLSAGIKLAMGSFPEDAARRVVIISDGNQNRGEVLEQAKLATEAGVGIDVVPIRYRYRGEVMVERLAIPPEIRKGQPVDLRVVINNTSQTKTVTGRLVISLTTDGQSEVVAEKQGMVLTPGKNVHFIRQQLDQPNFYTFEARFTADDPADDAMVENNRATAFADVAGAARILLIEDEDRVGEHSRLVDALRNEKLEVNVRPTTQLFTGLGDLQPYDAVILGNVASHRFSPEQIGMLVKNTQDLGAGLIMLGGPDSFGAGGWSNSELEKAMPVDFHIKSAKVVPKGALVLLMHASEMAQGNHWQKVVAKSAIKVLGSQDYCGMLHWNGNDRWLWNHSSGGMLTVGPNREKMLAQVDRMSPGDMPQFDPSMVMAQKALSKLTDAAAKHMIIISDGDPSPAAAGTLRALANSKITVTTVGIGTHGAVEQAEMKRIATVTGGKYYMVKSPNALPQIYQKEASRVARPLIHENPKGFQPQVKYRTELISKIDGFPPIKGYVMTSVKEDPLVEVALVAPEPGEEKNSTILAHWQYGLGRSVAFTTDAGNRWANDWTGWANYDKLFSQMVRFAMRPSGETGKFSVVTEAKDGKTRIIVQALDENDDFKNFLTPSGQVLGPDMKAIPVKIEQTAPGRYEGTFASEEAGSYFIMVQPGRDNEGRPYAPVRSGMNIAYSAEFSEKEANEALMITLAGHVPTGGAVGQVIKKDSGLIDDLVPAFNPFRHDLAKATSSQDAWYWLIVAAGLLFFADVFNRRVTVNLEWVPQLSERLWVRLRGLDPGPAPVEYMERLRSRKAEATSQFETQKAAIRFAPKPEAGQYTNAIEDASAPSSAAPPAPRPSSEQSGGLSVGQKDEESYTDRLLRAKKKVWDQRKDT